MEEMTCEKCDGKCCKYVALEIDTPEELADFENIKWYVCHENVQVFVNDDNEWTVEFLTKCAHLGDNNLCKIYEKRPEICRAYSQEECHFHNDYSEKYTLRTIEDVEKYIQEIFLTGKHELPDTEYEESDDDDEDSKEEIEND